MPLVSSISSKKRTKTSLIGVKLNSFIRFLEEMSAWKNHFDSVWPLANYSILGDWHISISSLFSFPAEKTNRRHFTEILSLRYVCQIDLTKNWIWVKKKIPHRQQTQCWLASGYLFVLRCDSWNTHATTKQPYQLASCAAQGCRSRGCWGYRGFMPPPPDIGRSVNPTGVYHA